MPRKSRTWVAERIRDPYHRLAKRHGIPSRAYYKLAQIDARYKVVSEGQVAVDLGSAPGGWLVYLSGRVGEGGFVLGVDKVPVSVEAPNVRTILLDVETNGAVDVIASALPQRADLVTSDMSPKMTGVHELDVARQLDLARRAMAVAREVLKKGGSLVVKLFQGPGIEEVLAELRREYRRVHLFRPPATRKRSREVYAVCLGFRG
ncbi:TPA: RlmE family RNA methyltransferase [Candidatus Micrarchaeota archaeon]|nr:RlmE family RNA methyltransferase [Candidatus Micrarchaeota archaeon]